MHFSGSCKRDVCLFDNTSKSVTGWDLKVQKMQAFLFLQLIVLMHFVPVEFFILEIKGYNKKILEKKLSGLVVWPDRDWSPSMISSWHQESWLLISDFLEDLWLYFFHFFFLTWVLFFLSAFLLLCFLTVLSRWIRPGCVETYFSASPTNTAL